jgi:hypothetical protein
MPNNSGLSTNGGKIFIPGNTPSSKNSNVWTGRMLIKSKTVRNYIKNLNLGNSKRDPFILQKDTFFKMMEGKEKPYFIEFTFIRDNKRLFDLINAAQIIQDLMVKSGWIEDDNYTQLVPVFNKNTKIDKENPGVYLSIH